MSVAANWETLSACCNDRAYANPVPSHPSDGTERSND